MSLVVEGVTYRYQGSEAPALRDVTLTLPAGASTAVVGLSGSGKTTLLSLLGLLWEAPPERGTLSYEEDGRTQSYAALSASQKARLRRQRFGFVLQSSYLLPHFSCAQNVGIPLALAGLSARRQLSAVHQLLEEAGLYHLRNVSAREISGGERQRLAVLRAVVHNPHVLFADEPLSNLDFRNAGLILDLLRRWQAGQLHADGSSASPGQRSLVIVSHSIEIAFELAEHFVLLKRGELVGGRTLQRADLPGGPSQIYQLIDHDRKEP